MKVAVVGGGGFRTPLVWESVNSVAAEAGIEELHLHDIDGARLALVSRVIEGMRRERGGGIAVRTTTSLDEAVDGAGAVFCAIRVGGLEGREIDETVPLRFGVLGQETVGPGGICFALRTIPVMLDIAKTVARRVPSAWFLNFTNPAGLVTEALRLELGDRVVGICDSPTALCARVAGALGHKPSDLTFAYAGLNHLGWLLGVRDGSDDLLPPLLAEPALETRLEEAALFGTPYLRALGAIPNEYLVYLERPDAIVQQLTAAGATRAQVLRAQQARFYERALSSPERALRAWQAAKDARHGSYMAEARRPVLLSSPGSDVDEGPGEHGYAAIAAAFLRSAAGDAPAEIIVNVANRGSLADLDADAVVEVPCTVGAEGPAPAWSGSLPPDLADLVARVKEVERTTIRASVEGSRRLALEALSAHPVVPSRAVAEKILDAYTAALPSLGRTLL